MKSYHFFSKNYPHFTPQFSTFRIFFALNFYQQYLFSTFSNRKISFCGNQSLTKKLDVEKQLVNADNLKSKSFSKKFSMFSTSLI